MRFAVVIAQSNPMQEQKATSWSRRNQNQMGAGRCYKVPAPPHAMDTYRLLLWVVMPGIADEDATTSTSVACYLSLFVGVPENADATMRRNNCG